MKDLIEPILKHQKGQQIAQKQAETLLGLARSKGLDPAALSMRIPVITAGAYTRSVERSGIMPGRLPWRNRDALCARPVQSMHELRTVSRCRRARQF